MLVVCSWCKHQIEERMERSMVDCAVSHGICEDCAHLLEEFEPVRLGHVLDRFAGPVLLIGPEGRVIAGNSAAAELLDKDPVGLCGRLSGEVIECVHAREKGGCGKAVHCSGCTIRNSVNHTRETGESRWGVASYQHVFTPSGVERMRILVTTEKWRDRVLLRIDKIEPSGAD